MIFDPNTRNWHIEKTMIKVDATPFAKGGLRMAYHMLDLDLVDRENVTYVLKVSIDPDEDVDVYHRDVEMQLFAKGIAEQFNYYNPPKKVGFVGAWLLKLVKRGGQVCAVERFISGPYRKHNNNYGFVNEDERNTPQAFSHFSYEVCKHQLLVCDIQGVADLYTDPQIHTTAGEDKGDRPFGKGNLGQKGIDQFLKSHRCNAICRYLKLPPINPRFEEIGTVPVDNTVMQKEIERINIRVFEVGGRLAMGGLAPEGHAPTPRASKSEHLPLLSNKKQTTKITITAEESGSNCECCLVM
uniref:Alpha-type protein kinase domain-containing protein n=1 Tax=Arcella intermedia TaxID=1963864 RepID=A0A6B2LAC4_9EUKA